MAEKFTGAWSKNSPVYGRKIHWCIAKKFPGAWPKNSPVHGRKIHRCMAEKFTSAWPKNSLVQGALHQCTDHRCTLHRPPVQCTDMVQNSCSFSITSPPPYIHLCIFFFGGGEEVKEKQNYL